MTFFRILQIIFFGFFSYNIFSMEGINIIPKVQNGVGRIMECNVSLGVNLTYLFIGTNAEGSFRITRQTNEFSGERRNWKTNEFIPPDKITISDSLSDEEYELIFSSPVENFQLTFKKSPSNNSWKAYLKFNKDLFLDIEEKEFICRPEIELQNWVNERLKTLKTQK